MRLRMDPSRYGMTCGARPNLSGRRLYYYIIIGVYKCDGGDGGDGSLCSGVGRAGVCGRVSHAGIIPLQCPSRENKPYS